MRGRLRRAGVGCPRSENRSFFVKRQIGIVDVREMDARMPGRDAVSRLRPTPPGRKAWDRLIYPVAGAA